MERLGEHICALLDANDCVVVPGVGAFLVNDVPARIPSGDEQTFAPPSRQLVFNGALRTDDGLLTARLMQETGMGFEEARTALQTLVGQLQLTLSTDGAARLEGIGRLRQDMAGNVTFEPSPVTFRSSPMLYGLTELTVRDVADLERLSAEPVTIAPKPGKVITRTEHTIDIHVGRRTLRYVASVAAVLLLTLVFALPTDDVRTTDIASLGIKSLPVTDSLSLTTAELEEDELPMAAAEKEEIELPVTSPEIEEEIELPVVSTEKKEEIELPVASAEVESNLPLATPEEGENDLPVTAPKGEGSGRIYHVIVASLPSTKGADAVVQKYIDRGFPTATTVVGDDRVRISIASFADKAEGEAYVASLRQDEAYKNVWLLSVRNK